MKVVKNGICRDVDESRKQEFLEKGYTIEGVAYYDRVELLEQENVALKQQNEELRKNEALKQEMLDSLKQECEALKSQIGGETNGESEQPSNEQPTESAEQAGTRQTASKTDKTEVATRGKK